MNKFLPAPWRLLAPVACCLASTIAHAAPLIFNATESAAPGEVIYLQGDDFSNAPQVWFHRVLATDTSLTPDVQLTPLTSSNQAITVNLPKYAPLGLYAVWVKDSGGNLSAPTFINKARAMSFEFPEVSPGYVFRIFGRNLFLPGATPTVTFVNGISSYPATVVTGYANNADVIQVTAPAGLSAGTTYTVNVSNGCGHNATANYDVNASETTIQGRTGGSDPFNLGVPWGADFANIAANVINVVSSINPHTGLAYGADSTGSTNCLSIIQQALTDAGTPALYPNGATVYLPAGTYLINRTAAGTSLNITSKVVLKGAGIDQTIINDTSPAMSGYTWFLTFGWGLTNASLSGATGFTYNQTAPGLSATNAPPGMRNYSFQSSKMFLDRIKVNGAYAVLNNTQLMCSQFIPQGPADNKVLMQNCILDHVRFGTANYPSIGTYGADFIFRNNTLKSYFARLEFALLDNLLVEGNHLTRDGTFPPPSWAGPITCGGIDPTEPGAKVINNTLDAINLPLHYGNDGEAILNQNADYYDFNTPSAVTSTTVTDVTRNWTPNLYAGRIIAIVNGPGMGQRRKIISNTFNTVTISEPWTKNPTTASTYSLTHPGADRWLVKGNSLSNLPRGIVFYTGGYDSVVVGNSLRDVGETLFFSSGQRTYLGANWYGRMDLNWKVAVTDNVAVNSAGTWANTTSAQFNGNAPGGNVLAGTVMLGTEFRRNVLQANLPNVKDFAIGQSEGYNNLGAIIIGSTFTETNIPALLGTIFDDNVAIHTANAFYLNTETYQTTIWNQLNLNVANNISDTKLNGATHASVNTVLSYDVSVFETNFNGSGTSTGGAGDIVDTGGLGLLVPGSGAGLATISSTSPFQAGSGSYLKCSISPGSGVSGHIQVTPTTRRTSWGRIFDFRTGKWLVNGGFDFFWRPNQVVTSGEMRPIDINNGANGLRLALGNIGTTALRMEVIAGAGGGGLDLLGTYPGGFAANQVYHVAVLFSTDPTTGVTTERIFCVAGTGGISTSSNTVGSGGLIGKGTFTLNPAVVTNTSGFLSNGPWNFGDYYGNGSLNVNDYDGLNLYSQDPGIFPAL